jgi:hypothetical protein
MSSPGELFVDLLNMDLLRIAFIDTKGRTRRRIIIKHAIDIQVVALMLRVILLLSTTESPALISTFLVQVNTEADCWEQV